MTASDRFMKKVSDYYNDLGYPVTWEGEGSKRSLEIQFKAESGYFTSMIFSPSGDDIIVKDEWGREQKIKATKGNLDMIKSWSETRGDDNSVVGNGTQPGTDYVMRRLVYLPLLWEFWSFSFGFLFEKCLVLEQFQTLS